jgi:hypothetical protein
MNQWLFKAMEISKDKIAPIDDKGFWKVTAYGNKV